MSMERFLFLGDSVTDCERDRHLKQPNRPEGLGNGWVNRVATELLLSKGQRQVWNRGYSGCRTAELLAQPDWLPYRNGRFHCITLMIGINDIWHPFNQGTPHELDQVTEAFDALLGTLRPLCHRLIVMEPLAIAGPAVSDAWWPLLAELQARQEALADKAEATWMGLQTGFTVESEAAPGLWAYDGVHPGVLGHRWLAKQWLRVNALPGAEAQR